MNRLTGSTLLLMCWLGLTSPGSAQHCPPIVESYLSSTGFTRNKEGLDVRFSYAKTGGKPKASYQAYLLAFTRKNAAKVTRSTAQQALADNNATIIETKIIQRNRQGQYESKFHIQTDAFVNKLITSKLIKMDRVNDVGGWKSFDDQIQLAIFIPFLDDKKYSVLAGLPRDCHECNYRGDSSLLFEPLGPNLQICFGIVQATKLEDGRHYIQMNGNRPANAVAK